MNRTNRFAIACFLILIAACINANGQDTKQLIQALSDKDNKVCLHALKVLTEMGPQAKDAVPALIEALSREDVEVCAKVALCLGSVGPEAKAAVPALTKALTDDNAAVRAYAAFALGEIGKPSQSAVQQIIKNIFDKNEAVRRASVKALIKIDPPTEVTRPVVLEILEKGDLSIIAPALHSLAEQGKAVVPRLREALKDEKVAYWACLVAAEIGPDAVAAVPELTGLLKHEDADARLQALVALAAIGEGAKDAAPAVLDRLDNDKFENVRYAAAYALGMLKVKGAAEQTLKDLMSSDDEFLRTVSAWAVARTNPKDKELVGRAVKMFVAAFKSKSPEVRRIAAQAVIEFDVPADVVGPVLVAALRDEDPQVVANAVNALAAMGPKALSHVDDALGNKDLRPYAIMLIVRLGPDAASAVPALVKAISVSPKTEDDVTFIREAQFALAKIGAGAAPAVPALAKSLDSDNVQIKASAAFALGKIGKPARGAVPKLRQALRSEEPIVKLASVRALLEIQPNERRLAIIAVPLFKKALDSEFELVRAEAATALGEVGELAKSAIPQLRKLLNDESELVREAAAAALKKL